MQLNLKTWPSWAKSISGDADIEDYSPAAVEKLMKALDLYVVDVAGVRPQFHALNNISMIDFRTPEEEAYYRSAWDRFLAEKAKIEERMERGGGVGNGGMQILAQFLKFRQAAELIRCEYIADAMYEAVTLNNQAACCAMNFKHSISKCIYFLVRKHGVPRELISTIWGGGITQVSSEKKKKIALRRKIEANEDVMGLLGEMGLEMEDLGLENAVLDETQKQEAFLKDPDLQLGVQNKEERQRNIDRFQKGKSLYCFFTFKAGGVGLSLHHTDELTKEKCRRKANGYAFREDIPLIPTRQRICFLSPTYSAMELVQGLGRCPRLTSLSDTTQLILFYKGTIEERVSWIVSMKLKCLRKVVKSRESWESVILGGVTKEDEQDREAQAIKELEDIKPEDSQLIGDGLDEDEEEE